jgi:transmembrane sensor
MVALPDGSRYRALAQHSRLDIRQVSIERIHLALEAGAARFEVSKRAERAFHVSAGSVEVVVLGTTFMVEREPARTAKRAQRVRVAVEQGRVRVRWRAGEVLLGAGDSRWFVDVPAAEPVAAVARGKGAPAARLSARKRRRQAGGPTPTWRQLAGRGMYAEAYELLSVAGPGTSAEVRDEPRDLFLAADSARLARQPRRALPYLRRIIERYPQDERAPLAAFTLGRLYLQLRQPASSAAAFAQTRELDDHGPLAEDALAREVQAWSEADRPKLARERATRYLQRYPEGRHRAAVRRWGGVE